MLCTQIAKPVLVGQFEPFLVLNPKDRFSRDEVDFKLPRDLKRSMYTLYIKHTYAMFDSCIELRLTKCQCIFRLDFERQFKFLFLI